MARAGCITADVRDAIIEAYQGVDEIEGGHRTQRVFLWEDGNNVILGNTYAYAEFLGLSWSSIHKVLRDAGHQLYSAPHVSRGEIINEFKEPTPVSEVVGTTVKTTARTRQVILQELARANVRVNELLNELLNIEEARANGYTD